MSRDQMQSSFTPGPWQSSQEAVDPEWWVVTTKGGSIIANVNARSGQEANARLIAAAPDLYGALRDLVRLHPAFRSKPIGAAGSEARAAQDDAIAAEDRAIAALAKAAQS